MKAHIQVSALIVSLAVAAPAAAQKLGQASEDETSVWRILAALLLCLGLAIAGAVLLKARKGQPVSFKTLLRQPQRLRLVESLRLSHQVDLHIVLSDDIEILMATSAAGVDIVSQVPARAAPVDDSAGQP